MTVRRIVVLGYGMAGHHLVARPARTDRRALGSGYTQTGQITPAPIRRAIRADTVFTPIHWPGPTRANTATNPALDPTSLGYDMAGHHLAARPARTERQAPGGDFTLTNRVTLARISRAIRPDTVFTPFHRPGTTRANSVTNPALDPTSKVPGNPHAAARPADAEGAGCVNERKIVALGYRVTGFHLSARPARTQRRAPGGDFTLTDQIAPARISRAIRPDTVPTPYHWPSPTRANTATNPALDPTSKVPGNPHAAARPADDEGAGE